MYRERTGTPIQRILLDDRDGFELDPLHRRLAVDRRLVDRVHRRQAVDHAAERSVLSVQRRGVSGHDEERRCRAGGIIAEIKSAIGIRGTTTSGTGDTTVSSKTVPVPTGAAIDDIAIVIVDQWTSATERTATITAFTEITGAHATRATTT